MSAFSVGSQSKPNMEPTEPLAYPQKQNFNLKQVQPNTTLVPI